MGNVINPVIPAAITRYTPLPTPIADVITDARAPPNIPASEESAMIEDFSDSIPNIHPTLDNMANSPPARTNDSLYFLVANDAANIAKDVGRQSALRPIAVPAVLYLDVTVERSGV